MFSSWAGSTSNLAVTSTACLWCGIVPLSVGSEMAPRDMPVTVPSDMCEAGSAPLGRTIFNGPIVCYYSTHVGDVKTYMVGADFKQVVL